MYINMEKNIVNEEKRLTVKEKKTAAPATKKKIDLQQLLPTLENMILTGFFKPRERLVESTLSDMFGVSRYNVRDAFKILEAKGIVSIIPFRGAVVSELSQQEVEETFTIRVALVKLAMSKAIENVTTGDIKILRKMAKQIERFHREDNLITMMETDKNLHGYIYQMSHNKTLARMINELRNRCHIIRYSAWSIPHVLPQVIAEHFLIVDAIEAGDLKSLCKLSERHILHSMDAYLMKLRAENAMIIEK